MLETRPQHLLCSSRRCSDSTPATERFTSTRTFQRRSAASPSAAYTPSAPTGTSRRPAQLRSIGAGTNTRDTHSQARDRRTGWSHPLAGVRSCPGGFGGGGGRNSAAGGSCAECRKHRSGVTSVRIEKLNRDAVVGERERDVVRPFRSEPGGAARRRDVNDFRVGVRGTLAAFALDDPAPQGDRADDAVNAERVSQTYHPRIWASGSEHCAKDGRLCPAPASLRLCPCCPRLRLEHGLCHRALRPTSRCRRLRSAGRAFGGCSATRTGSRSVSPLASSASTVIASSPSTGSPKNKGAPSTSGSCASAAQSRRSRSQRRGVCVASCAHDYAEPPSGNYLRVRSTIKLTPDRHAAGDAVHGPSCRTMAETRRPPRCGCFRSVASSSICAAALSINLAGIRDDLPALGDEFVIEVGRRPARVECGGG